VTEADNGVRAIGFRVEGDEEEDDEEEQKQRQKQRQEIETQGREDAREGKEKQVRQD